MTAETLAAEEAEFKLTAKDEHATLNSVQIGATKITEDTTSATFKGNVTISALPDGTYELEEITAPNGFTTISTFTFVVKNGVVTTVSEVTNGEVEKSEDGKTLTIKDERSAIQIDKRDITGENEVAGATLTLTNDDLTTEQWDAIAAADTDLTAVGNGVQWTSGDAAKSIVGLPSGTYTLKETAAPDGYAYAEDFTFTVEKDGTITVDAANKDENDVIIMKDDVTKVSISKKAMTGSDELAGAELKLYYVTQNDQGEVTLEVDAWTSGTEAHVIEGALIAGGTYKLVEIHRSGWLSGCRIHYLYH